jgi:peptidoglycan-associated lipoprotein
MNSRKRNLVVLAILVALLAAGCKKKPPIIDHPQPPPPPPPPMRVVATMSANPTSIERGQSSTLEWHTENAVTIRIEPEVGVVAASGSRSVRPGQSTTYRLTAEGQGGSADASARITVTNPPAPPPPPPHPPTPPGYKDLWPQRVKAIYFDYDSYVVRADQKAALDGNIAFLKQFPEANVTIEGNCDERGSAEYNLALGDKRANALKEALQSGGISADRIHTISFGKEKPKCSEETEACWQENRRGDFVNKP